MKHTNRRTAWDLVVAIVIEDFIMYIFLNHEYLKPQSVKTEDRLRIKFLLSDFVVKVIILIPCSSVIVGYK